MRATKRAPRCRRNATRSSQIPTRFTIHGVRATDGGEARGESHLASRSAVHSSTPHATKAITPHRPRGNLAQFVLTTSPAAGADGSAASPPPRACPRAALRRLAGMATVGSSQEPTVSLRPACSAGCRRGCMWNWQCRGRGPRPIGRASCPLRRAGPFSRPFNPFPEKTWILKFPPFRISPKLARNKESHAASS